ncbi:GNAT family N-acetyltransferase [Histidinibacterium aquaticum]|uniref:GNAT family N-acetyltransferase n=1 Tax=Histidinibacterium aquaticum TaxID=2613962 RepID=A0A5J5GKI2_9RHOB|nr:GNAT family N-acetyltransferase [Histidinibacterium aquaticum]KAA9008173.1 GNAT family N-acetyltransferase [Histidinibacterium aquaticum]
MDRATIRPFTYTDLPELHRMIGALAAHHGDPPPPDREALLRDVTGAAPLATILMASDSRGAAGYAALNLVPRLHEGGRGMELHHLWVEPDRRGSGTARRLIEAAKRLAVEKGCSQLTVGTHPSNAEAQAYYPRAGFEPMATGGPRFRLRLVPAEG